MVFRPKKKAPRLVLLRLFIHSNRSSKLYYAVRKTWEKEESRTSRFVLLWDRVGWTFTDLGLEGLSAFHVHAISMTP